MRNSIVRDAVQVGILAMMLLFIQKILLTMSLDTNTVYMVGVIVGVLLCFCFNLLSVIVMNITIIIRSFLYTPEDFATFLSGLGCKIDFTVVDVEDEEENKDE